MRKLFGLCTVLALTLGLAGYALAQTKASVAHHPYEVPHEVVLEGQISQIALNPKGMPYLGTYLFLNTPNGTIPVHLGLFRPAADQLTASDFVLVVGVLTSVNGKSVFLARTVKRGNETLILRSKSGIVLRTNKAPDSRGGSRRVP